jgi:DNA invertase Pin-like site-specific DNA recombinase
MTTFDIYARISQEGARTKEEVEEQLAIYEAACRMWADRSGVEIDLVVRESDVSGETVVDERGLGGLLERVENGESAGVLTPNVERFGRDTVEGCVAWKRIHDAKGRLVFVNDGIDSKNPEHQTFFEMRLVFASDFLRRQKKQFLERNQNAAKVKKLYLACKPPVGYYRDHNTGRIAPHPKLKPLITKAFEKRAEGQTCRAIAEWLKVEGGEIEVPNPKKLKNRRAGEPETVMPLALITENGVRHLLRSRAYLGEATVQSGERGKPEIIPNAHQRMVSDRLWEEAQAAGGGGYHPNTGRLSSQVRLSGLVYCSGCGKRLKVGGSGKGQEPSYLCTRPDCPARAGIRATGLDAWVQGVLQDAVIAGEPHVTAVLSGDDRFQRALEAVEQAREELDFYRANIKVTDVGRDAWLADVAIRQAALDTARAELKGIPKTKKPYSGPYPGASADAIGAAMDRDASARLVRKVVVKPVGRGRRVHPAERVEVWLVGAEAPLDVASVTPVGDPETNALLAAAHTRSTFAEAGTGDQGAETD